MSVAERLLKRKTRIAETMHGEDNYIPESLNAGEQAIAEIITEILQKQDEISGLMSKLVRGL